jgi:Zn-dependent peptidase ImmA (M78 family)
VTGIQPAEMLGFSLTERPLPIIGINRKLAPNGRTFTLLHEFVHVLLRESSLCDIDEGFARPPQEQRTEIFCNAVAAETLVPRDALLSDSLVRPHARSRDWSDEELGAIARNFGVSAHVILRRLLTLGRTTQSFYASRAAVWREYEPTAAREDQEFRRNMPQEVISDLGRPFVSMLLDSYLNSNLSLSDTSRYLGLRASQVAKVRELVLRS